MPCEQQRDVRELLGDSSNAHAAALGLLPKSGKEKQILAHSTARQHCAPPFGARALQTGRVSPGRRGSRANPTPKPHSPCRAPAACPQNPHVEP